MSTFQELYEKVAERLWPEHGRPWNEGALRNASALIRDVLEDTRRWEVTDELRQRIIEAAAEVRREQGGKA